MNRFSDGFRKWYVFVLFALLTVCVCLINGDDWPDWQGPNRDNKSAETGLLKEWPAEGPSLVWKVTDIGKGYSTVAVSKGMVYTTGDVGQDLMLYAMTEKGQMKWKVNQGPAFTRNRPGARSTPVIDGEMLFLEGGMGRVTCYRTADGRKVWEREFKELGGRVPSWGFAESPLLLGNMLIVTPGGKNGLVALNKATGKNVWLSDAGFPAHYSSPIVIKEKNSAVIVQGTGAGLFIVNAANGKKIWSNPFCTKNTANCPTPAYADGYIFWANGYGKGGICVKADFQNGNWSFKEAWQTKDMVCHHGGFIIDKGYIYGNHNNGWSCLDLKTGAVKWNAPGVGKGSLCYADGMLYLFSERGGKAGLAAASPDSFKMSGSFSVAGQGSSWAHPVIANGNLYLRYDTNLYCYNVKAK